jgi:hypothetical protein
MILSSDRGHLELLETCMNRFDGTLATTLGLVFISAAGMLLRAAPQNRTHDPNRPEAIPVVVSPQGFPQNSFSLPPGRYAFVVVNRTGFHDITVYLERMPGSSIAGAAASQEFGDRVGDRSTRIVRSARLTPGTYRLRVEGRPAWVSEIRVK